MIQNHSTAINIEDLDSPDFQVVLNYQRDLIMLRYLE